MSIAFEDGMRAGPGALLTFFAVACGSDDAQIVTNAGADWQLLSSLDWQLDSGREDLTCTRKTVDRDLVIAQFEPLTPSGTHHTALTTGEPSAPDGQFGCDLFEARTPLFGAEVGSNRLILPDGVVMRVRKGQQLVLGLHLFNTTPATLRGKSGVRALIAKPTPVQVEAEAFSVWAMEFALPAARETRTSAACTLTRESTIFALHPHMHSLGTHMKVVVQSGDTERVIHDAPFDFAEQLFHPIEPLKLHARDRVEIECTHRNTRDSVVRSGGGSADEMCSVAVYGYPAASDGEALCRY
jgi:hypothetical protein